MNATKMTNRRLFSSALVERVATQKVRSVRDARVKRVTRQVMERVDTSPKGLKSALHQAFEKLEA